MAKFPEPPTQLTVPPDLSVIGKGTVLWRLYFIGGAHPTRWQDFRYFGPTNARFDHHRPPPRSQTRGILYAAADLVTCLAEVFQATRVIDRNANTPWLVGFSLDRDISLLDLMGTWPTRAGASMAISSGPRPRARRWSAAIHAAYPAVEGLLYGSSMNANRPSVAINERARSAVPSAPRFNRALADPALLGRLNVAATRIGYRLV